MVLHGGSAAPEGLAGTASSTQVQPSVLSLPPRWKASQQAGAGLNNVGNSCYLNSTLQCLAYIPPLAHLCLSRGHSAICTRAAGATSTFSTSTQPCTFCIIERQLTALLRSPRGASVSPGEVVRHLHLFSRTFVRGRQEDSHELLTALLDVLERDGRKAAMALGAPKACRTIVEDLFLGRWQSQVRCLVCGHESNTYESFATLPLDIAQARTVLEGLRAFTEAERLDGSNKYRCDRCRQLVPAIKQTTIWDEPNVLVVHLKRFELGSLLGKVSRHVAFPEVVDLQPFMTPSAARARAEQQHPQHHKHQQQGDQQQEATGNGHHHHHHHHHDHHANGNGHHHHHGHDPVYGPSLPTTGITVPSDLDDDDGAGTGAGTGIGGGGDLGRSLYRLTGVLVHQGSSLHSGHYYALVRDSADRWSCMNDSQVYGTSLEQVRQEQAYLLFYTRQTMKLSRPAPLPTPTPPPGAVPAGATAAAAPPPDAGKPRQVYGPPRPPHLARTSGGGAAAEAATAAGAAPAVALPQRPARVTPSATLSARLPAKVVVTPKQPPAGEDRAAGEGRGLHGAQTAATAANGGSGQHQPALVTSLRAGQGPAATAGSSISGDPGAVTRPSSGTEPADAGDTVTTAAAEVAAPPSPRKRLRSQVDAEAAALKACASWSEGVKRFKGAMEAKLRESEWMGQLRSCLRSMQQAGISLQEALAVGRGDPRRQALNRAIPPGLLHFGKGELDRMLRTVLMSLGWLGGLMFLV